MKKIKFFVAIIIATLSFTACSNGTPVTQEITLTAVESAGSGITIPADSVYFKYQYPKLGRWLDCNLKNMGFKKVVGYFTKGEWVPVPERHISDSLIVATTGYRNVPKGAMIVDTAALFGTGGSNAPGSTVKEVKSFDGRDYTSPKTETFRTNLWLGIALLIIIVFLALIYWAIRAFRNPGTSAPVNQQGTTTVTVQSNSGANVNVGAGGTTITYGP